MFLVLVLVALLLPSLSYSAARSPAAPPPETKQTAASGSLEDKEEKAGAAIDSSGIVGAAGQRFFATMTGPKGSVSSLGTLAAQQLLAKIDQKDLQASADGLVLIWTKHPEKNFETLLNESYDIINLLFFPGLSEQAIDDELSRILYAPLVRLLLQNPAVMEKISTVPLFDTIGRWPSPVSIEDMQFNDHGYVAAESPLGLFLFNCTHRTMLTLQHKWLEEKARHVSTIKFAYDGSAVAAVIQFKAEQRSRIAIFDSTSGKLMYAEQNISDVNTSPVVPLFTYINQNNAVIYDCTSKKVISYPTIGAGEIMVLSPVISPQGKFSAYEIRGTGDTSDVYVQDNHTRQRYLLIHRRATFRQRPRIKFNDAETVVVAGDFGGPLDREFKLFSLDNLAVSAGEQEPYLLAPRDYQFSPRGTQLFIPGKSLGLPDSIIDLRTKKIETFGPGERVVAFLSEDIILLSTESKIPTYDLYMRDQKRRITLAPPPLVRFKSSFDAYPRNIHEESMKLVYRDIRRDVCIFDIRKQQGCLIRKSPQQHEMWDFDTQGTLYYMGGHNIEQLMIDPTDCSLEQLFFLLGLAHALLEDTPVHTYRQLLESPILTTFSPEARKFLTDYIGIASTAPERFFDTRSKPKKVASSHPRGSTKKNNNRKRVVA